MHSRVTDIVWHYQLFAAYTAAAAAAAAAGWHEELDQSTAQSPRVGSRRSHGN